MELNNLKPAKGSTHHDKRVGRGAGSGHGGYSTCVSNLNVTEHPCYHGLSNHRDLNLHRDLRACRGV